MDEIGAGVYVETGYPSGNVGLVVTDVGVVCIDAPMMPEDVQHWRSQIQTVTDKAIVALVQTDCDPERTLGTCWLRAPIIAHDAARERLRTQTSEKVLAQVDTALQQRMQEHRWRLCLPEITFSERVILCKGSHEIHVIYGGGHSPATSMVYLPEQGILFAGDVVCCSGHPSMAQAETKQWLSTLNQVRKMPIGLIIPGHGNCCGKEATHVLSEYIREMRAVVRRHYQAGRTKSETSSAVVAQFMDAFPYQDRDREVARQLVKGGSDRIYDEYRAAAKADAAKARGSPERIGTRDDRNGP